MAIFGYNIAWLVRKYWKVTLLMAQVCTVVTSKFARPQGNFTHRRQYGRNTHTIMLLTLLYFVCIGAHFILTFGSIKALASLTHF